MRFLNLAGAKNDLNLGLSQSEIFTYSFWTILLQSFMFLPVEDQIVNGSEYFFGILLIVVTAVGYRECFLANGGNNGVEFLPRTACLGWIIGWRVAIPFAVLYAIYFLGVLFYTSDMSADVADAFFEGQLNMFITDSLVLMGEFIYWLLLSRHLRSLRHMQ